MRPGRPLSGSVMFAYIVRRILATIPVMAVVAVFVFALLYLSPGDPAAIIAGDTATVDDIVRIRAKLGLDQPVYIQFGGWVWRLLQGDLGISIFTNLPVSKLVEQRLEPNAALTITTLIVSVLAGMPMGGLAAWRVGAGAGRAGCGLTGWLWYSRCSAFQCRYSSSPIC